MCQKFLIYLLFTFHTGNSHRFHNIVFCCRFFLLLESLSIQFEILSKHKLTIAFIAWKNKTKIKIFFDFIYLCACNVVSHFLVIILMLHELLLPCFKSNSKDLQNIIIVYRSKWFFFYKFLVCLLLKRKKSFGNLLKKRVNFIWFFCA